MSSAWAKRGGQLRRPRGGSVPGRTGRLSRQDGWPSRSPQWRVRRRSRRPAAGFRGSHARRLTLAEDDRARGQLEKFLVRVDQAAGIECARGFNMSGRAATPLEDPYYRQNAGLAQASSSPITLRTRRGDPGGLYAVPLSTRRLRGARRTTRRKREIPCVGFGQLDTLADSLDPRDALGRCPAIARLVTQLPDIDSGYTTSGKPTGCRYQDGTPAATDVQHVLVSSQAEFIEIGMVVIPAIFGLCRTHCRPGHLGRPGRGGPGDGRRHGDQ